MSTHNIGFYEEISKIITYHQISSNTHLISSAVFGLSVNTSCQSSVKVVKVVLEEYVKDNSAGFHYYNNHYSREANLKYRHSIKLTQSVEPEIKVKGIRPWCVSEEELKFMQGFTVTAIAAVLRILDNENFVKVNGL